MGGGESTPEKKELDHPWRTVQWNSQRRNELMDFIKKYKPSINSVEKTRILLVGPVCAGKSSFFNSINSIYSGHITGQAITGIQGVSVTTQYRAYTIKDGRLGQLLPFVLCDTMGLEAGSNAGLNIEDIDCILSGNTADRYQFNPVTPMQRNTAGIQMPEGVRDRIHCVVYVIDATTLPIMPKETKMKLNNIRKKVNLKCVPQMVILTKVDEACEIVKQDLRKVYHSIYIKEKIKEVSDVLGISILDVVPVKNYSHEGDLDENLDILLLSALQKMLFYAHNFLDDVIDKNNSQN